MSTSNTNIVIKVEPDTSTSTTTSTNRSTGINTNTNTSTSGTNSIKRKVSTNLTLQKKLEAVRKKDAGLSTIEIAMEYNISETTVRRWIREREKLEKHSLSLTSKRLRLSPVEKVNQALTIWFHGEQKRNNALTVIQVKAKAQEFFQRFGGSESFKASDGWYRTWKFRNGIRSIAPSGEPSSTNTKAANQFTTEISELIDKENLTLYQIFNADETELYFKMMPNRSSIVKTEHQLPGHKKINDRLTVMACCNANSSFKMPLLVIGKHQKPAAMKHIAPQLLSVKYTNQKNSWMSAIIFERWFREDFVPQVVAFLKSRGLPEKAILLLDNDKSHPSLNMLTVDGIRAIFFPSYVTPLIQPLDQGVINVIKRRYKAKFLKYLINAQADGMNYSRAISSFNIKNAIDLIGDAWDEISEKTISNSWKKLLNMPVDEDNNNPDYVSSEQIYQMCKKLRSHEDITLDEINEWIHSDGLSTLTDEEIIDAVENPGNDETAETENDHYTESEISPSQAMEGLDCAISFFEKTGILISLSDMKILKRVRDELLKIKNQI
ncbi:jerky protein homolog-like isoform X1 [Osmia bicornis bicornis]|uniref:jerky protein homolog-like isoform X1 n=1 Tax=Osmia bicornis bicornis TaxID=1437191 RepID=UPI0010F77ADE|nr:jerky protein homolog-like isoform X1 [Osmia bicornis bicornis]